MLQDKLNLFNDYNFIYFKISHLHKVPLKEKKEIYLIIFLESCCIQWENDRRLINRVAGSLAEIWKETILEDSQLESVLNWFPLSSRETVRVLALNKYVLNTYGESCDKNVLLTELGWKS